MENTFAVRLKKALSIKKVTQQQLADKTGIGKSTISQYLSDKYKAKQDNISKIADALDINETWLMGISDEINRDKQVTYSITNSNEFTDFDDAMRFIIRSPYASAYGGYDLEKLSEEEVIDFANELSEMFKIIARSRQKK